MHIQAVTTPDAAIFPKFPNSRASAGSHQLRVVELMSVRHISPKCLHNVDWTLRRYYENSRPNIKNQCWPNKILDWWCTYARILHFAFGALCNKLAKNNLLRLDIQSLRPQDCFFGQTEPFCGFSLCDRHGGMAQ